MKKFAFIACVIYLVSLFFVTGAYAGDDGEETYIAVKRGDVIFVGKIEEERVSFSLPKDFPAGVDKKDLAKKLIFGREPEYIFQEASVIEDLPWKFREGDKFRIIYDSDAKKMEVEKMKVEKMKAVTVKAKKRIFYLLLTVALLAFTVTMFKITKTSSVVFNMITGAVFGLFLGGLTAIFESLVITLLSLLTLVVIRDIVFIKIVVLFTATGAVTEFLANKWRERHC